MVANYYAYMLLYANDKTLLVMHFKTIIRIKISDSFLFISLFLLNSLTRTASLLLRIPDLHTLICANSCTLYYEHSFCWEADLKIHVSKMYISM